MKQVYCVTINHFYFVLCSDTYTLHT